MKKKGGLPFVFINVAMTADGKLAPANRHFEPFGGPRDKRLLLELRATADAVMAGARTVDLDPVTLGPGSERYRKLRLRRGLAEYNLRIVVSGAGTIDPAAKIFQVRHSPVIILTTARMPQTRRKKLESLGAEVRICGKREIDFAETFGWLRRERGIRRLLCEGGGEINGALFESDLVDEIHLTICPLVLGGRDAPTLADGRGVEKLIDARRFRMVSRKEDGGVLFLVYRRDKTQPTKIATKALQANELARRKF